MLNFYALTELAAKHINKRISRAKPHGAANTMRLLTTPQTL